MESILNCLANTKQLHRVSEHSGGGIGRRLVCVGYAAEIESRD